MTTLPYPKDYATNADGQFSQIQIYPAHARLYNPSTRHAKDLSQLMQLRAMMVALDNQEALVKPPKSRIRRNGSMLSEWQLIDPHTNQTIPRIFPNFLKAIVDVGTPPVVVTPPVEEARTLLKYKTGDDWAAAGGGFTRASEATYTDIDGVIRTAASGELRDSHYVLDPVTQAMVRTTLIEKAKTNKCLYSQDFTNPAWITTGVLTPNDAVAPDGTTTATRVELAVDTELHQAFNTATQVTGSVWVKGTAGEQVRLSLDGPDRTYSTLVTFDGQWQRVSVMKIGTTADFTLHNNAKGTFAALPAVTFHVWGAQLENELYQQSPYASSYIPTTSEPVTRDNDLLGFPIDSGPASMSFFGRCIRLSNYGIEILCTGYPNSGQNQTFQLYSDPDDITMSNYPVSGQNSTVYMLIDTSHGDLLELVGTVDQNGSVGVAASINGGSEVQQKDSQHVPFQTFPANGVQAMGASSAGYIELMVVTGVHDLEYFRAQA